MRLTGLSDPLKLRCTWLCWITPPDVKGVPKNLCVFVQLRHCRLHIIISMSSRSRQSPEKPRTEQMWYNKLGVSAYQQIFRRMGFRRLASLATPSSSKMAL